MATVQAMATATRRTTLVLQATISPRRPGSRNQGCSTLSTDAPFVQSIESGESGSVSVLAERSGLIAAQDVVGKAAYPGEDPWVVTDAGLIFAEGHVAGVVQLVLDVPMASDCGA